MNAQAKAASRRWAQEVTENSRSLALKKSADASANRKAEPFRSAMSMLTFFINRAGKGLPESRRQVLEAAKNELRALFQRPRRQGP